MAWSILRCDEVDSTNNVCKTLAAQGADDTAVIARRQTAGKGRLGRSFLSPEGGLYLSVLWRGCPAGQLLTVTPLAAVAVCRAIQQVCGAVCGIKWCNDVVLNGKKLCGILTESSLRPDGGAEWLVVGIGVNVAQTAFPPDIAEIAASLAMQGYSVSPDALAEVLLEQLPKKEKDQVQILDIGTGPGFFAILLAEEGYQVTAVDYTEQMLQEAKSNAADLADQISFKRMDAQNLEFPKETFDYIVTRNVTWNLEHPKRAYREWKRVLKPGGKILNFDANWYAYLYDDKLKLGYEQDRQRAKEEQVEDYYEGTDIAWMENIAKQVPLSPLKRPKWDLDVLKKIGLDCWADETIGERVLSDAEKINYQSTPVFMVCAVK